MNKEAILMYDDDSIVEYRTNLEGWVDNTGRFWGVDEHMARYSSCTHKRCECGNIMTKWYTACDDCRSKARKDKYDDLEFKEWDGKTPVALHGDDNFFFDIDELYDYCYDNEITDPNELQLVLCKPVYVREVDEEFWDECHTDYHSPFELMPELEEKVNELNKFIRSLEPKVWEHDKYKTKITLDLT